MSPSPKIIACLFFAIPAFWIIWSTLSSPHQPLSNVAYFGGIMVFSLSYSMLVREFESAKDFVVETYRKAVLLAANIDPDTSSAAWSLPRLEREFVDFQRRGKRSLPALYRGSYSGPEHSFPYEVYRFRWEPVRRGSREDSRKVEPKHRHGIVAPFRFVTGVQIESDPVGRKAGAGYRPASLKFNDLFRVGSVSRHAAARLLNPSVVLLLESAAERFSGLNLQISASGVLCLSVDDDLLEPSRKRQHNFGQKTLFAKELSDPPPLPRLAAALELVHSLMTTTDNNFQDA